jgi:hypothetical protein
MNTRFFRNFGEQCVGVAARRIVRAMRPEAVEKEQPTLSEALASQLATPSNSVNSGANAIPFLLFRSRFESARLFHAGTVNTRTTELLRLRDVAD